VNRSRAVDFLLPAKSFYFLYFAAGASLAPFLVLFYRQQGLNEGEIGLLAGMQPLMTLAAASLWGGLADSTRQHRVLLRVALVGTIAFALVLSRMGSFGGLVLVALAYAFFMAPIIPLVDNSVLELLGDRSERYGRIRLWGAIGWGIAGPVVGRLAGWATPSTFSRCCTWAVFSSLLVCPLPRAAWAAAFGLVCAPWQPTGAGPSFWR
jgi:PPP family 3-phenylpropionic acid transporter